MATSFWSWRQPSVTAPTTDGANALDPDRRLEQVELYTTDGLVLGLIAPEGERMSDILNRERPVLVHGAQTTPFLHADLPQQPRGMASFNLDQILLAMPPARVSNPARRISRRRRRVLLQIGPYQVVGTAHMPPGANLDPYVLRTRARFIAVTDALVRHTGEPQFERGAPVVLVNTAAMTDVGDMLTVE
jgi:hypothetical protein